MITNILLIAVGVIFVIATAVFLFELARAPLGAEEESGFRCLEETGLMRPGRFDSAGATIYSDPAPHASIFRDLTRQEGSVEDSHPAYTGVSHWDLRKEERIDAAPSALGVPVTDDAGLMTGA